MREIRKAKVDGARSQATKNTKNKKEQIKNETTANQENH